MADYPGTVGVAAARAVERLGRAGAACYERGRMLPRLIPVGPDLIADASRAGRRRIVALLVKALRGERARGRAGHWSYSLDRHVALLQALAAELTPPRHPPPASRRPGGEPADAAPRER